MVLLTTLVGAQRRTLDDGRGRRRASDPRTSRVSVRGQRLAERDLPRRALSEAIVSSTHA
jgi:hypothetical protein